jgi:UDP-GlcNAc:undecaprenyl-phosphate GlcNAc-1-phosphate transferase
MRWPSLFAFLGATVSVWLFTSVVRSVAARLRLVDRNEGRKLVRYRAVPRIGGIAIASGFGLTVLALNLFLGGGGALSQPLVWLAALGVFGVGFYDDLRSVRAEHKLAALALAGGLVAMAGYRIENLPFVDVRLSTPASVFATSLWFATIGTAWNFVDGLDGLASGLTILASLAFWFGGFGPDVHVPALLAGAALGFLAHNRHPSTIFMGDSGSFFLGFWIALSGIVSARGGHPTLSFAAVLVALAWPLLDLCWAFLRRLQRASLFQASGDHLHYMLNARLGHRAAVQIALLCAGASGVISVVLHRTLLAGLSMAGCLLALLLFSARTRIARPAVIACAAVGLWLVRGSLPSSEGRRPEAAPTEAQELDR